MIKSRIYYGITLLLGILFVMAFGGKLAVCLLVSLIILPLCSGLWVYLCSKKISAKQTLSQYVIQKGESTSYTLTVFNDSRLLCPLVRVILNPITKQPSTRNHTFTFSVLGEEFVQQKLVLTGGYRGKYIIGAQYIEIIDFLGVFRFKKMIKESIVLKVFPKELALSNFYADLGMQIARRAQTILSQIDRTEVSDMKNYQTGDHIKDIHWKLSAKRGDLLVKNYEILSNAGVTIAMDVQPFGYNSEQTMAMEDMFISAAVSIEQYLNKRSVPMSLAYATDTFQLLGKGKRFEDLLDITAFLAFRSKLSADTLLKELKRQSLMSSSILLFTHAINEALCNSLLSLKAAGYHTTLLYFSCKSDEQYVAKQKLVNQLIERKIDCYVLDEDIDLQTEIEKNK